MFYYDEDRRVKKTKSPMADISGQWNFS